jgi:hypothetical protein
MRATKKEGPPKAHMSAKVQRVPRFSVKYNEPDAQRPLAPATTVLISCTSPDPQEEENAKK